MRIVTGAGTIALASGIYVGATLAKPAHTVSPAPPAAEHAITIDEQAVISALNTRTQIVGLTGDITKTVTLTDAKWYGDKTYTLAATGTFKLGVATDDITITTHGNTVKVRFPQPKILTVDMPFDQAVIAKDVGLLRQQVSDSELQALYGKAREGAIEDIKRNRQAFDKAGKSVERTIEGLIESVDGVEDIVFDEVEAK